VLGGGSAGVGLVVAFTLARELTEDDTIVAILPDSGHFIAILSGDTAGRPGAWRYVPYPAPAGAAR
jgi:hypothetical protein